MIKLTGYKPPLHGHRFTTKDVWINPALICSMEVYEGVAERDPTGKYLEEKIPLVSIGFAAAYPEEQVGISVTESIDIILRSIHFWKIEEKEYLA